MTTLCLSIVNKQVPHKGFYIPAPSEYRAAFRNEGTRINALKKLVREIKKNDNIEKFIIEEYEGVYRGYGKDVMIASYTRDDIEDYGLL